jgi:hypothetical protein
MSLNAIGKAEVLFRRENPDHTCTQSVFSEIKVLPTQITTLPRAAADN